MNRLAVVRAYSGDLAGTPVPAYRNSGFFDPTVFRINKTFRSLACQGSLNFFFHFA
jgi:hypothetical protein